MKARNLALQIVAHDVKTFQMAMYQNFISKNH